LQAATTKATTEAVGLIPADPKTSLMFFSSEVKYDYLFLFQRGLRGEQRRRVSFNNENFRY